MKISKAPSRVPKAVKVSDLGIGCVYRLVKPTIGSQVDESKLYIRGSVGLCSPELPRGVSRAFSTCLSNGKVIPWGNGHEENMAYVMDVELLDKGEAIN